VGVAPGVYRTVCRRTCVLAQPAEGEEEDGLVDCEDMRLDANECYIHRDWWSLFNEAGEKRSFFGILVQ
jgi:hypothetical protein